MELLAGEAVADVAQHIDHVGMAAGAEHDQALAANVHRDEALVDQQRVVFPARAVFAAACRVPTLSRPWFALVP